jgi:two-component system osmolarity sensor histidine kinase EnvZ
LRLLSGLLPELLPKSLFGRTAAALLVAFLVFEAIAFGVVWFMVIQPLAARSADDLAAKILLSAQTWVELPPQTRADYEMELAFRHDLALAEVKTRLPQAAADNYFGDLIAAALSRRANQTITLKRDADPDWDWMEIQVADKLLRVGFDRKRYALKAPLAAVGVFLLGALLTVLTALFMVRQVSQRLNSLARKAGDVGQGRTPELLPETGARELRELTVAFNRMAEEVQSLLENRTVLLAGVSHDLRTPITRLRLALSLLDDADATLVKRMDHDLNEMNN